MNDGGRREGCAGILLSACRPLRDQRQHDELESNQRSRGGADDDVEAVPLREFRHARSLTIRLATDHFLQLFRVALALHRNFFRDAFELPHIVG